LSFVQQINQQTGADIAASDDTTGNPDLNGDWTLEVTVGNIESNSIIDTVLLENYAGILPVYNGKEYVLTSTALSWDAAQAEAQQLRGNLVTINDAAEETWLKQTFGDAEEFWIGITDRRVEGQFEWVNGEAVSYTNWAPGEPNNDGNQDYGAMNYGASKQWDDNFSTPTKSLFRGIVEIGSSPTPTPRPGVIGLETSSITVNEGDGSATVAILRNQGSDGTVTVDYRTVAGSATADIDYTPLSGTVTFAPGETRKTVSVPILDDSLIESIEAFGFAIDNVTGGATLLVPRTAQVTIRDNDSSTGGPGEFIYNGNRYVLTSTALSWDAAQSEAQQLGGNLVTITDAAEETWLKQTFGDAEEFWIGLTDRRVEGQFEWVNGEVVTYTNWAPGEPNNTTNQDYGVMNYGASKQWDDSQATILLRGIIEIGPPQGKIAVPPNEPSRETVISGLVQPTAVEWTPDGSKMLVAEKGGVVRVYENGTLLTTSFIDISAQVNGVSDRGLLDIAIHPDFPNNPYVYLLYTYDPPEVYNYTGLAGPDGSGNRAGRLTRVTADISTNYTTAVPGSEVILLGTNSTWNNFNGFANSTNDFDEPPAGILPDGTNLRDFLAADSESHTIGSVEFGPSGALYVTNGDGTSFNNIDPRTIRVQDIDNLSGKVLRINPITGEGLPDNPFYNDDPNANRSKVYQYGIRNSFRMTVHPETEQVYLGEVGWTEWEEINTGGPGANFGWPYFEGASGISFRQNSYQGLPEAQAFYDSGQPVVPSIYALNHGADGINAIVLGDVYTGSVYPEQYRGDLFFNDLGQGIVRNLSFDAAGGVASVETFATGANVVVQINQGPDGRLYYVDLDDGVVGRWLFV
jgi:glucose/arabinose dehydrogenase